MKHVLKPGDTVTITSEFEVEYNDADGFTGDVHDIHTVSVYQNGNSHDCKWGEKEGYFWED